MRSDGRRTVVAAGVFLLTAVLWAAPASLSPATTAPGCWGGGPGVGAVVGIQRLDGARADADLLPQLPVVAARVVVLGSVIEVGPSARRAPVRGNARDPGALGRLLSHLLRPARS